MNRKANQRILAIAAAATLLAGLTAGAAFAANATDVTKLKTTGSCNGCDLTSADLKTFNILLISGAVKDLQNAKMGSALLNSANLSNANLTGADLNYANMSAATVNGVTFRNCNLKNANFSTAKMNMATNFYGADLTGATPPASWNSANLTGAKFGTKTCGPNSYGVCN